MSRLFGTDGVRGVANRDLTPDLAFEIGMAAARVLTEETHHKPTFVVGADTRVSCGMLASALIAGINAAGADVVYAGVIATPGVAWLTLELQADAGAMISASHNSFEYNGIKLFSSSGFKLPDEIEDKIETHVKEGYPPEMRPVGDKVGRLIRLDEGADMYTEHLLSIADVDLTGLRLVIDCANGASYHTAPKLFQALGAEVIAFGVEPDGFNINLDCGSTHADRLAHHVIEEKADMGLAFDGDADRLIAIDDQGELCDGDVMLAILAMDLDRRNELSKKTIVATVMSNIGLQLMTKRFGMTLVRTAVGDRYVLEHMLQEGFCLGGEQSGHVILLKDATTGDGQLTALRFLRAIRRLGEGQPLSELRRVIQLFPQVLENVLVKESLKNKILEHETLLSAVLEVEEALASEGRVLLRKSGTEPLIRVMIEGPDLSLIRSHARHLASIVETLSKQSDKD